MHAKTDSEATSYASSPPRQQAYYVQSPSHESTPAHSPAGSPPHSASLGQHSRESSTSRYSGSLKPGRSGKINPNQADQRGGMWREEDAIVEEEAGLLQEEVDEEQKRKGIRRRFYVLGFMFAFLVLFFFFALILWGASHNKHPIVTVNSITFHNFVIQAGTDASLVPTGLSTLNSTVKLSYRNTGTFFGVHVSSTPLVLYYSQLVLAAGNMNKFYQSRKSERSLTAVVQGNDVPLYGGGSSLSSTPGKDTRPIPLSLNFTLRSRAYVLGKLVRPKFYTIVKCSLTLDQTKIGTTVSLKNSCEYSD
ncbi:Late embryogenesis abundant protein [Carex littledalei]|uniref:Late embryogenesis abundant protein n=1 Tax=Carex littledalei TaxID=544730 RepID=A0A833RKW5_9POAL|nr:Late embryogenesis abundant protein [Carex littledalei]